MDGSKRLPDESGLDGRTAKVRRDALYQREILMGGHRIERIHAARRRRDDRNLRESSQARRARKESA
jgi:hypothetical protein